MRVNVWAATVFDWLAMQAAQAATLPVVRDTLFTKVVAEDPSWWDRTTSIASGLMTIAILVLAAALVPAAINVRKTHKKISDTLDRVYGDINPLVRHMHSIADNLDYVTTSLRVDVQQVNQTVALANQKLLKTVELAEDRINDLNALLEVAQEEAEAVFVATVAGLKGMGAGAGAFARGRVRKERKRVRDPGLRQAVERIGDALDESFDEEELSDGKFADQSADGRSEAPRIRPRG